MSLILALAGCSSDRFADLLAQKSPGDVEAAWGVQLWAGERSYRGRSQIWWENTDRSQPYLDVLDYTHAGRDDYVYGYDLVLPRPGDVDALLAAWGEPARTGTSLRGPGREPATNEPGYWFTADSTTRTWFTGSVVTTLWTPDEGAPYVPRVTVREWVEPAAALASVGRCELFGTLRRGSEWKELQRVDSTNGGRYRAPSVTVADLQPLVLVDSDFGGKAQTLEWRAADPDGELLALARSALDQALTPASDGSWTCPEETGTVRASALDGELRLTIGPWEDPNRRPPPPRFTPAQEQVLSLASTQAVTLSCFTTANDYVRLSFSVRGGRVVDPSVTDVQTSFGNAVPAPRIRTDRLGQCLVEHARGWTFPPELEADGLEMEFGARPL